MSKYFNLNLEFVKKFIDYEDINTRQPNGSNAVGWGDGYNWYEFNGVENHEKILYQLQEEYKISLIYKNGMWSAGCSIGEFADVTYEHENPRYALMFMLCYLKD